MPSGRDRLKQQILTLSLPGRDGQQQAKVTSVGPPVTVSWQGGTYQFPHQTHYTPVLNDIVTLVPFGGSWLITGKPVDFP